LSIIKLKVVGSILVGMRANPSPTTTQMQVWSAQRSDHPRTIQAEHTEHGKTATANPVQIGNAGTAQPFAPLDIIDIV
jgi:hypothetical protein